MAGCAEHDLEYLAGNGSGRIVLKFKYKGGQGLNCF